MFAAKTRRIWNNLSLETIHCETLDEFKEAMKAEIMSNDDVYKYSFTKTSEKKPILTDVTNKFYQCGRGKRRSSQRSDGVTQRGYVDNKSLHH